MERTAQAGRYARHGWGVAGQWHEPAVEVVSMYVDQASAGIPDDRAAEFGFTLCPGPPPHAGAFKRSSQRFP
jgi:hypothetical protein